MRNLNGFTSKESVTLLCLKQYLVDSTLTQKVVDRGGGGFNVAVGWFFPCNATDKCEILTVSLQKNQLLYFASSSI